MTAVDRICIRFHLDFEARTQYLSKQLITIRYQTQWLSLTRHLVVKHVIEHLIHVMN